MRLTRNELLERYPSWNEVKHDIVKTFYGDIPLIEWNKEEYEKYSQLEGTLANIEAVEAYIWTQNGDYSIYRTLIGEIKIGASGIVLCGDLQVKYEEKVYSIYLNLMYGLKALSIFRNNRSKNLIGFSNTDGLSSPCIKSNTKELDRDLIEKVLKVDPSDYGESVRKFMDAVIDLYNKDKVNHIMEKCFSMRG